MSRPGGQRGLVTVELAVGIVTATLLTACLVSLTMLGVVQAACQEAGSQVARQTARGDGEAVSAALARAPAGAEVEVDRQADGVRVTVAAPVVVVGLGTVSVTSEEWAAYEPGVGP